MSNWIGMLCLVILAFVACGPLDILQRYSHGPCADRFTHLSVNRFTAIKILSIIKAQNELQRQKVNVMNKQCNYRQKPMYALENNWKISENYEQTSNYGKSWRTNDFYVVHASSPQKIIQLRLCIHMQTKSGRPTLYVKRSKNLSNWASH